MADEALRSAIDAIRSRLHEEIEAQLAALETRHADELETVRRAAEAEAEQRWSTTVDAVRAEWATRLEGEVAAVRADAERRMVAESMRLRVEAEQIAAEAAAASRAELERLLAEERQRAEQQLAEERQRGEALLAEARERAEAQAAEASQRADAELAEVRQRADSERAEDRQAHEGLQREAEALRQQLAEAQAEIERLTQQVRVADEERAGALRARDEVADREQLLASELNLERQSRAQDAVQQREAGAALADARLAERQSQLAMVDRVLTAIRTMDTGRSLSDVLAALVTAAAAEAPRVALFVANAGELRGWKTSGFDTAATALQASATDGLLAEALRRREPVVTGETPDVAAPAFAELPPGRAGIAVPLLVGAQPVAALYADNAAGGAPDAPASWPEAIQILGRHASVILAHLTAARAAESMRRSLSSSGTAGAGRPSAAAPGNGEDSTSARRYARLLVSEIKLYNEAAVRAGREQRDLLTRLKPEIERARQLYTQRIPAVIDSRGALFQQELVQTLADGDASLLGSPA